MSSKKIQQMDRLVVDLLSSTSNEAMLDIVLVANDGGEIPACRFVLGARSVILQKMLFGERRMMGVSAPKLHLEYSTHVVRTLVHYCRTNELDQVWVSSKDEASARELVKLGDCANSFELKGLTELVHDLVSSLCKTHPFLSCAVYDQASCLGESVDSLKLIARHVIRKNPETALLRKNGFGNRSPGVSFLGEAAVEEVLSDPLMCTEEINMFRAVALWADACHCVDSCDSEAMHSHSNSKETKERRFVARKITARCIDLSKIAPSDLLGSVSDSGLVNIISVSNALIKLALRAEREGVVVAKFRALAMEQPRDSSRSTNSPLKAASGRAIIEQEDDHSDVDAPDDRSEALYDTPPTIHSEERLSKCRTLGIEKSPSPFPANDGPLTLPRSKANVDQKDANSPLKTARSKAIIEQEDDNSVVEAPDDWSEMSRHTPPTKHSKKRAMQTKTMPPQTVTPQRATQKPRVTRTPPRMVHGKKRESFRESLGHFLAKQVDTLCIHPYNKSADSCFNNDVPYDD